MIIHWMITSFVVMIVMAIDMVFDIRNQVERFETYIVDSMEKFLTGGLYAQKGFQGNTSYRDNVWCAADMCLCQVIFLTFTTIFPKARRKK